MNEITGPGTHAVAGTPSPQTNRSTLSEAWYRALYGAKQKSIPSLSAAVKTDASVAAPTAAATSGEAATVRAPIGIKGFVARATISTRSSCEVATLVRKRAGRTALATPAARHWRAALARRTLCRFSLPNGTRIDLLLQQRGRRLHAVAISGGRPAACGDRRSDEHVAAALGRARVALLAYGVRLATTRSQEGLA